MKWVKDSVHGEVFMTDLVEELMDTPEMQRLRRINQTSFANLIYPGANHTRFEHSIGVYYLTNRACLIQGMEKEKREALGLAGLLHDIGHTAYSHVLERITKKSVGQDHEQKTNERIVSGNIREVLEKYGYDPQAIVSAHESAEGKILTGDLGTDRIDYLLRDSKYTGVAYGTVEQDRLLRMMKFVNNKLVLDEKALDAAESMLIARSIMFSSVYKHHVAAIASRMLQKSVEQALNANAFSAEKLFDFDDNQLTQKLLNCHESRSLMQSILDRRLYKRAQGKPIKEFSNWLYLGSLSEEKKKDIEMKIAEESGLSPEEVFLRVPKPWFGNISITVLKNNDFYSIEESSLICRVLKEAQWDKIKVSIICPKEKTSMIKENSLEKLSQVN